MRAYTNAPSIRSNQPLWLALSGLDHFESATPQFSDASLHCRLRQTVVCVETVGHNHYTSDSQTPDRRLEQCRAAT